MTTRADLTEAQKLSGDISEYLFEEFCAEIRLHFGGADFELDGDDDDPWTLIIRRKPDGKRFEVELEATAREIPAPQDPPATSASPTGKQET
jgi:hypothetical protein